MATPAYNVSITTTTTTTTSSATSLFDFIGLWACSGKVANHITQVAHGIVRAITRKVTCLPAVLAGLFVSTFRQNVALLEAIVAQPQVARWHGGS